MKKLSREQITEPSHKFFRGDRVRICDEMPVWMDHFLCGCDAIVTSSSEDVDENNRYNYGLLLILPDGDLEEVSWYEENQLTLKSNDRDEGKRLIRKYEDEMTWKT